MPSLTITTTRVSKNPGVIDPDKYLKSITDINGYDYNTVREQMENVTARDMLNATGTFKSSDYPIIRYNTNGTTTMVSTVTVLDISIFPGLTKENASEIFINTLKAEFAAAGLGEYQAWRQDFLAENFNQNFDVTITE